MTREEAITRIKDHIEIHRYHERNAVKIFEALDMAINALKKQIPVKPKRIDQNAEFDGNWKKVCPSCGRVLVERITTPEKSYPIHYNMTDYCRCGQKICWSED